MSTLPSGKNEIRRQVASQRPDFQTLEELSEQIVKTFQTLELFQTARAVGAYMPLPDEIDISPLFPSREKTFYIPAFDADSGMYRMARLTPELKKGRFGILEPAEPAFATEDEMDLILVPGMAFDRAGGRIGRGGGFYDRLLPLYRAVRVGLCFDFQCLETLPTETHDVRMDRLVTDQEILKFAMNS
jgi:5-formyltetrahydrofolate cyclo-ligase